MSWLKMLLTYFPIVIQGVVAVETAIKGASGASKKQLVLDVITAGAQVTGTAPDPKVAQIGNLIDAVVTSLNKSGVFTKSATPAPPATV